MGVVTINGDVPTSLPTEGEEGVSPILATIAEPQGTLKLNGISRSQILSVRN